MMKRLLLPILATVFAAGLTACDSAQRPTQRVHDPTNNQPVAEVPTHASRSLNRFPDQAFTAQLRLHEGHLYTRARINGSDAGWFLFDTGAALHTVSPGVAGRLALERAGSGRVRGIAGVEEFDYHPIDELRVGGASLDVDRLAGVNVDLLRGGFGIKPAGLLGFSAFKHRPFTIDVASETLTVHPLGRFDAPADATVMRMGTGRGIPVITIRVGRHAVPVILDTGQDAELVLPLRLLQRDPSIASVPVTSRGRSAGVGGTINTTLTWTHTVKLLGTTLGDVPTTFEDNPPGGTGRVGLALLKNFELTFDPRQQRVIARWRPMNE